MPLSGVLDVALLVPTVTASSAAVASTTRRWRARRVRRMTDLWIESIGRAVTEERLRSLVEHGI
jgi:hypothetical protein